MRRVKLRRPARLGVVVLICILLSVLFTAQLPNAHALGYATITRVQGNARGTATSGSTITVTMASTPTSGNMIVIVIFNQNFYDSVAITVSSISETGVTWTGSGNGKATGLSWSKVDTEIWIGTVGSGASKTITVQLSASLGTYATAIANACEYNGLASASSVLDKTATNGQGGFTSAITGTTATTTQANELWIGGIGDLNTGINAYGPATQSSPTNSFTLLDGANLLGSAPAYYNQSLGYLERIVSSTGTANSGVTLATLDYVSIGVIATFKALLVSASMIVSASGLGTGYYATLTYYNSTNTLTTRYLSGTGGNSSVTDNMYIGSSLTISGSVSGAASQRWITTNTTTQAIPSSDTTWTFIYRMQWKPTITLTGTTVSLTVSITARTANGTSATASGLYTSWSNWCDDSTTLTFSQQNTGGGGATERLQTTSTRSWSVTSALTETITYLHQWKPTITLTGTTAALTVSITARTLDGSPATASGLFTSWSDWCDDSTTLTFSTLNTGGGSGTERLHTVSTVSWSVTSALAQTITYIHQWEPPINTSSLPNSANYVTVSYTLDGSAKSQVVSGQGGNSSWTDWADESTTLSIGQTLTISGTERYKTTDTFSWTVSDASAKSVTYRHQWKPTVTPTNLPTGYPTNVTRTLDGSSGQVTGISSTSPFSDWVDTSTSLSIADPVIVSTYQRWKNSNATSSFSVTSAASKIFVYVAQTQFAWSFKASDGTTVITSSIQQLNVTDPSAVAKMFVTGNFTGLWVSNGTWTVTDLRYLDDAGGYSNILVSQTPYSTGGARSITSRIYNVTLNGLDQSANALNGNTTIRITYPSGASKSYTSLVGSVSRGYTMPNGTYVLTVYWNGLIVNSTLTSHAVTADESLNISTLVYYSATGNYRMAVDQGTMSDVNAGVSTLALRATATGAHTIIVYVGSNGMPSALTIDGTTTYAGTDWAYDASKALISIPLTFSSHDIWMNWAGTPPSGPSGGPGGTTTPPLSQPLEQMKEVIVAVTKTPWLIGLLVPFFLFCGAYYGYQKDKRWLALIVTSVAVVWLVNLLFFANILPSAELSKITSGYFPLAVPYVGLPTMTGEALAQWIMSFSLLVLPISIIAWFLTRE